MRKSQNGVAMRRTISKGFEKYALLALPLGFFLLSTVSGAARIPDEHVGPSVLNNLNEGQNHAATKSEPQTPADPQVKAVLAKMAAAGLVHQTTVEDVRKAYLFYPRLSGTPEHVFRIEERQIPGPGGNIRLRVYTPSVTAALPILVSFHGGGFVAGSLDTHDTPLRSMANRCGCIIVSVAYRLVPENKYPAARGCLRGNQVGGGACRRCRRGSTSNCCGGRRLGRKFSSCRYAHGARARYTRCGLSTPNLSHARCYDHAARLVDGIQRGDGFPGI